MALNSFSFLIFFAAVLAVLSVLQLGRSESSVKRDRVASSLQIAVILISSMLFMALADLRCLVSVLALTIIVYLLAIQTKKTRNKKFVAAGVIVSLAFLGYFKYCDFFVGGILRLLGLKNDHFNIIIPLGISYYTFSAMSYLIDVGRKKYPAEKNIAYLGAYMCFFPKITAGPIVRANEFLPQLHVYKGIKADNFQKGIQMFAIGLFKKIVLADRLSVFVNEVFRMPQAFHSATILLGVVSYTLQIYFDFSGYSDMAIGISKILGFEFQKNFNLPLISRSVSEYWRRWHISLGAWFKDYLFYPLSIGPAVRLRKRLANVGVSRKTTAVIASAFSLLIVWLATGLWHGANVTFIVWGLIQFVFLFYESNRKAKKAESRRVKFFGWLVTIFVVVFGKVFFRADSVADALRIFKMLVIWQNGLIHPYTWSFFALIILIIGTMAAYRHSKKLGENEVNSYYPFVDLHTIRGLTIFMVFCGVTIMLAYFGDTAFIYGRF